MVAAQVDGLQIELDLPIPKLLWHLGHAAGGRAADIVVHDVKPSEPLHAIGQQIPNGVAVGQITDLGVACGAGLDHQTFGFFQRLPVDIDQIERGPFACVQGCRSPPVAPARPDRTRTGDHDDFTLYPSRPIDHGASPFVFL